MFKKKTITPTTVSAAIEPFVQVRDNLLSVIGRNSARVAEAARRIEDAKNYAVRVEQLESVAAADAEVEMARAAKIADALSALLGDLATPVEAPAEATADA